MGSRTPDSGSRRGAESCQHYGVIPAYAGTHIPETVVMGPRFRGDDRIRIGWLRLYDTDRAYYRGLGFRWRRRHPGGSETLLGAGRLWRLRHYRADGAEHQGRDRDPR